MNSSLSSSTVEVRKDDHVADQASHNAKPCGRLVGLAPADRALSFDRLPIVVRHDAAPIQEFISSAPEAEDLALTAVKQPTPPTAVGANFFCSGDGLGIHEPGSKTRGGRIATPAPSGRALESATCPAVTRSRSPSGEPDGRRHASQPPAEAAAVNLSSRSTRTSSGGGSTPAAGITSPDAAAFSSELPVLRDRQAVAAFGFASAATADRASAKNASTFFVVAASVIAANSKSISAGA